MNRKPFVIAFAVILLCAGLTYTAYYFQEKVTLLREEQAQLTQRVSALERETDMLLARRQVYVAAFSELESMNIGGESGGGSGVDFYSEAQQAVRRGGSTLISNSPGSSSGGRIKMRMTFSGDYYSTLRSLAELRSLRDAIRVVSMALVPTQPSGEVRIDAEIEAPSS